MKIIHLFLVPVFILVLLSCSSSTGNENTELSVTGSVLKFDSDEIVRVAEGEDVTGSIDVTEGANSREITIYFLDEEGNEFLPDRPIFQLDWLISDISTARVSLSENEKWRFRIRGESAGQTQVVFTLFHVTREESIYDTPPITINID